MRAYIAFTKKEFMEFTRNYKLIVLGLIFLLFGVMSPLAAKYTPQIMGEFMPVGIQITIADPTALDAWTQFFKNVSQLGLFVLVILYSGMMSSEYGRGTLVHLVTKGLNRGTVILAKFTSAVVMWTGAYLLCFGISFGYTWYYWREEAMMKELPEAVGGLWLFGILLLAVTVLGSTVFRNSYGGLLFTGAVVVLQMLVNLIPKLQKWNPVELISKSNGVLLGEVKGIYYLKPAIVAVVACVICLIGACVTFNRKRL